MAHAGVTSGVIALQLGEIHSSDCYRSYSPEKTESMIYTKGG